MKRSGRVVGVVYGVLVALMLPGPASAHHAAAGFDMTQETTMKGTVTNFEWTNPHAYIYLDVKDDKGGIEKWTAELPALGILSRDGWRRDTLKAGDQITVIGNRAKDGRPFVRLQKIVFSNGQELTARVL